ncbi:MAG: YbhB/YbcL family Raf kinase inhibitor-like protein [bacterium]|nr:YbhB/YbcL family Raf kinase inhibitor-like protein [bacterium]
MKISSPAFENQGKIPAKFTCDGENISPELIFSAVPESTVRLALIMDDPDIPDFVKKERGIEVFDHWIVFNMPAETQGIKEGQIAPGVTGLSSRGTKEYVGACPPDKEHRYFFKLYALDKELDLDENNTRAQLAQAMQGHVIEQAELIGLYERKSK